ncbi:MAG: MMPL family transporter [Candidatus Sericytochromatia bacterium]
MTARFHSLGLWLYRYRWAVVAVWIVLALVGGFGARLAPDVLKGGAADIPGSSSARAAKMLREEFKNPYQFHFLVTVSSDRLHVDDEQMPALLGELQGAVGALDFTNRTFSYVDRPEPFMRSEDGHRTFFLVGLEAQDNLSAEQMVTPTREAMAPVLARWQAEDPSLKVHLTGETAISYDATQVLMEDTAKAEKRILPMALVLLLVAFGALAAAGIPVLVGATAAVISLGMLVVVGHFTNLSGMAQNISMMVGLGVGIDYSLIIVSRFREALGRGCSVPEAVAETSATAGQAVVYSGLTVMIGFLALFLPNLIETNALALAGSVTVLVSVLLAVTLLPAVLGLLGKWIDWPFGLSRLVNRLFGRTTSWWYGWAQAVMRHPARYLVVGTALLLLLAAPAATVKFGQFSTKFLPTGMESGYGLIELERMSQAGQLYPISVVVKHTEGQMAFSPQTLKALAGVVQELRTEPIVQDVNSVVENASTLILMNNLFFRGDVSQLRARFPEAASLLISEDGTGTVIQVVPKSDASYADIKDLARRLQERDWSEVPGMQSMDVAVSGAAAVNNDFEAAILSNMPKVVALVFLITFALLYVSFRSVVLPLKALFMNTLSVSASFGALVLVFQHGWGAEWLGLAGPLEVMVVSIPIIVFCCVFGLSMDYEVFLLSRIKEEYDECGDNTQAVASGLAHTGGIITNAALIMLLVFGAFIAADVILTKMLGFGLAVAVLVDALIIRLMLVPSFMKLVGDWNWWPNKRAPKAIEKAAPAEPVEV